MNDDEHNLDIIGPDSVVEVMINNDGSVIWVNVDGICRLRVCRIPRLVVVDNRVPGEKSQEYHEPMN